MNKKKPIALTFSIQNKGHGTFPRHERMALALKKKGYQVIWISPYGYQNKNFQKIDLLFNFLPNFLFVGIYIKILLTCIFNKNKIENTDIVFGIREYDALALFYNPFFLKCKKVFFSRGDVISILNVNLSDKNIFQKIIDKTIILIYPWLQRLLYLKTDLNIFQANFLAKLYLTRINKNFKKTKILSNNCSLVKKKKLIKKINKKIIIGFAAPMYWSCKGLDVILSLYKALNTSNLEFQLFLAGDGPQAKKLKRELLKISSKNFKWNGWVNNMSNFFKKIDLLIIPSNYDSCPNLLLEAISNKKFLFASNISAHNEILKNKDLLFPINKIDLLVNKILKLKKSSKFQTKIKNKVSLTLRNYSFDWDKKFSELVKQC